MVVDIHKLIAAINPDVYCKEFEDEYGQRTYIKDEIKKYLKENPGDFLGAAKLGSMKVKEAGYMEFDDSSSRSTYYANPFKKVGLKAPIEKHSLSYDAFGENLEPIYFWILDNLYTEFKAKEVEKLIDNFASSPGSGHFSEMGGKATRMQEEAMKILGAANQVIKSILNIIYDLKEFRLRLDVYDRYKNGSVEDKKAGLLSLKQIWMDTVDMKRGNGSLNGLAQQLNFVTIRDAFMAADSVKQVGDMDLNERVKRILEQRISEFFDWLDKSEKELRKRYEIEKTYLKGQVNTVQLYAKWAKPYLSAASQLEQRANPSSAALVTAFNTAIFELVLIGKGEYKPEEDVDKGDLPKIFRDTKMNKYYPIIIVELKFRSVPERAGQQGYGFRGKVEIVFTSYALRDDEFKILKEQVRKDDMGDVLNWIEGSTEESLKQIQDEIDYFLKDLDEKPKSNVEEKKEEDTNPFSALASIFKKEKKKVEKKENEKPGVLKLGEKDSDMESVVRSLAIIEARKNCRKFYDSYKKAHNMPTF